MTAGAYYDYAGEDVPVVRPVVDAAVACIIGRELIEAVMFITSHIGAVVKHPHLSAEEKRHYLKRLIPAVATGFLVGLIVTIAVAIPLSQQADKLSKADAGVSIGEGVSKTIAFFFVIDLTFHIPKWFGISRYVKPEKESHETEDTTQQQPEEIIDGATISPQESSTAIILADDQIARDVVQQPPKDVEKQEISETTITTPSPPPPAHRIAPAWELALSLLWNTFRESCEGGILSTVTIVLSQSPPQEIGASVGTGIGAAIILAIIFYLGGKYISTVAFGVAAAVLVQLLAMGLATGAVREFEEAYGKSHNGVASPVIYETQGATAYGLTSLEFMGWSDSLTALTLSTWLISLVFITAAQIWHNVLGYPLLPQRVVDMKRTCKKNCKTKCCKKRG